MNPSKPNAPNQPPPSHSRPKSIMQFIEPKLTGKLSKLKELKPPALNSHKNKAKLQPWEIPLAKSCIESDKLSKKIITKSFKSNKNFNSNNEKKIEASLVNIPSEESFVPYGPYPIPFKAVIPIIEINNKLEQNYQPPLQYEKSGNKEIANKTVDKSEKNVDFELKLMNAVSVYSNTNKSNPVSNRFLKSLDELLKKAKNVNIISSSDDLFADGSSQNKTRPNNKGKNNTISYKELDQKLDNLDIKHRKIANEPVIAQPVKSYSDKVDRILDNIPQNTTSKYAKTQQMLIIEKSKLDMLHGDLDHVIENLKIDHEKRRAGHYKPKKLSDEDVAACKPPPVLTYPKEKDWLYSDVMVYSLDTTGNKKISNEDEIFKLFQNVIVDNNLENNFALALKHLYILHNDLKCPVSIHEQFWRNHCETSSGNFTSILSRLSLLYKAKTMLCVLLRAASGFPLPSDKEFCRPIIEEFKRDEFQRKREDFHLFGKSPVQVRENAKAFTTKKEKSSKVKIDNKNQSIIELHQWNKHLARSKLPTSIASKPSAEALSILFASKKLERQIKESMDIQSSEDEEDNEDNEDNEAAAADNDIDTTVKDNAVQNQESPSKVWKRDENLLRILAKHWIGMIPWKVKDFIFAGENLLLEFEESAFK